MNSILNAVVDVTMRGLVSPYLDRSRQGRRATNFIGMSYMDNHYKSLYIVEPRAGSGVVRMDPLRFLAGCRTRQLNQV